MKKIVVAMELTPRECDFIGTNSLERCINTAIQMCELYRARKNADPDAYIAVQNLVEIKDLALRLWSGAQNALFQGGNKVANACEQIQEDLLCLFDQADNDTRSKMCQIVVDRFKEIK